MKEAVDSAKGEVKGLKWLLNKQRKSNVLDRISICVFHSRDVSVVFFAFGQAWGNEI